MLRFLLPRYVGLKGLPKTQISENVFQIGHFWFVVQTPENGTTYGGQFTFYVRASVFNMVYSVHSKLKHGARRK